MEKLVLYPTLLRVENGKVGSVSCVTAGRESNGNLPGETKKSGTRRGHTQEFNFIYNEYIHLYIVTEEWILRILVHTVTVANTGGNFKKIYIGINFR